MIKRRQWNDGGAVPFHGKIEFWSAVRDLLYKGEKVGIGSSVPLHREQEFCGGIDELIIFIAKLGQSENAAADGQRLSLNFDTFAHCHVVLKKTGLRLPVRQGS